MLELSGEPELSWQVFGEALLIEARDYDVDAWRSETFVVAACGGSARSLEPQAAAPGLAASFAVVGEWLVRCGESSQIEVFTVGDEIESHVLFPIAAGCQLHELGEGLAAIDPLSGTLVLHTDPSDPGDPPRVLSRDVAPGGELCERGRLVDCWAAANAPRTIGFGDHVLVPHPHPQSRFQMTATMVDIDTGEERPFTDASICRPSATRHREVTGALALRGNDRAEHRVSDALLRSRGAQLVRNRECTRFTPGTRSIAVSTVSFANVSATLPSSVTSASCTVATTCCVSSARSASRRAMSSRMSASVAAACSLVDVGGSCMSGASTGEPSVVPKPGGISVR